MRAGLQGGVLLSATNAFDLIRSQGFRTESFASGPNTNLWDFNQTYALGSEYSCRITLTSPVAALDMNGAKSDSFTPCAAAHVTLDNVDTAAFELGLAAWMTVDSGTAQDLVGELGTYL